MKDRPFAITASQETLLKMQLKGVISNSTRCSLQPATDQALIERSTSGWAVEQSSCWYDLCVHSNCVSCPIYQAHISRSQLFLTSGNVRQCETGHWWLMNKPEMPGDDAKTIWSRFGLVYPSLLSFWTGWQVIITEVGSDSIGRFANWKMGYYAAE